MEFIGLFFGVALVFIAVMYLHDTITKKGFGNDGKALFRCAIAGYVLIPLVVAVSVFTASLKVLVATSSVLAIGILLFGVKASLPSFYALLEIAFAIIFTARTVRDLGGHSYWDVKLFAAAYVLVRGFDNLYKRQRELLSEKHNVVATPHPQTPPA